MWKAVLAGTTALALVGTSVVYAQQRSARGPERERWQPSQEDMQAFAAARIAALKAGLMLNADQEKNWPAFEAALKDLAKLRVDRRMARRNEQPASDPTERLRRRADALTSFGAALKKLADAQAPLYSSLDEAQKRRFAMLARPMRARGAAWQGRRGRGGPEMGPGEPAGPRGFERRGEFRRGMRGDGERGDGERQAFRHRHHGGWGGAPDSDNDRSAAPEGGDRSGPAEQGEKL